MEYTSIFDVQKKIELHAKEFLQQAYGLELLIPVKINSRLKSSYGRFTYERINRTPVHIEIGKNYIDHQDWDTILSTLIHECIHYALFIQNLPFNDGHPVFEAELKKWGSHSTGTVKYKGRVVEYGCSCCNAVYSKKKKYPAGKRYLSGCCRKPIVFLGEKVV